HRASPRLAARVTPTAPAPRRPLAADATAASRASLPHGPREDRRMWCRAPRATILGAACPPEPDRRRKARAVENRDRGRTSMNRRLLAIPLLVVACTGQGATPQAEAQTATRAEGPAGAA